MPDLTTMKNIGGKMARKLASVGITSPEELIREGAKQTFFRLKTLYPNVCLVHLYALEGAVRGVNFDSLSRDVKTDLKEFNDALKGKGGSAS
ncbi:MAG: TfoX/Sxy family DNA transformation protein [Dysosmobacter sp.]|nr:TfoX/Sxy family DNA transformation protein [Dysosmobacter sp.]